MFYFLLAIVVLNSPNEPTIAVVLSLLGEFSATVASIKNNILPQEKHIGKWLLAL
jgi:hypothetical protein